MLRFLLRIGLSLLMFSLRHRLSQNQRRAGPGRGGSRIDEPGGAARKPTSGRPVDRNEAVDVPFTEIDTPPRPPAGPKP